MTKYREQTIKYIVPNLRHRWKEELKHLSDDELAQLYEDFSLSVDAGDNDAKFLEWVKP